MAVNYEGFAAIITYHPWWPSTSDPFYRYNIAENTARTNYYGPNYTPYMYIDGFIDASYDYNGWENRVDQQSFVSSPLTIDLSGTYNADTRSGTIDARIFAEQNPGHSNLKVRVAILEDSLHYNAPNGTLIHNQTFRDMVPNTSGEPITLAQGDTVNKSFDFTLGATFVPDYCKIVVFVQSDADKYILQGAKITLPEMYSSAAEDDTRLPKATSLAQNYPNPFNAQTRIDFRTTGGQARLDVFDLTGALVRTLVTGNLPAGEHTVVWDGVDQSGSPAASGVYFYRLTAPGLSEMRKMTLLK